MRGDSIRDLYAKTLALLGLGVLAGTGALVDYWPSGGRLPAVESGFAQPEFSLALAVPDEAFEHALRVVSVRPSPQPPVAPPAINLAVLIPDSTELEFSEPVSHDVVDTIALSRPAVLIPVAFAEDESAEPLGEEVSLSEPPAQWTDSTLVLASAPVDLSAADDHGMLADVMKATKSSLVLTGRKTGASIVGAFRVVSGAVRKALPN